jgi:methylphosphotriester-DNA--protein-cysteine methyltransferase
VALADSKAVPSIEELARRAAPSARTISWLFPFETGLIFKAWRQRARIVAAIDRLSSGGQVQHVASQLGFSSSAAFSLAFRSIELRELRWAIVASQHRSLGQAAEPKLLASELTAPPIARIGCCVSSI